MVAILAVKDSGFATGIKEPQMSTTDLFKNGGVIQFEGGIITERAESFFPVDPVLPVLKQTTEDPEGAAEVTGVGTVGDEFTGEKAPVDMKQVESFLRNLWERFNALDTGTKILLVGIVILILRSR